MKSINWIIILALFSIFSTTSNAGVVTPQDATLEDKTQGTASLDSVILSANPAKPFSAITATIKGTFGNAGYAFTPNPKAYKPEDDNSILIEVFTFSVPTSGAILANDEVNADGSAAFSVVADMRLLSAGIYDITVDLYLDGSLFASKISQLEVSAVPLPPAVWLLLSGLVSLFAFGKKKKKGRAILSPAH